MVGLKRIRSPPTASRSRTRGWRTATGSYPRRSSDRITGERTGKFLLSIQAIAGDVAAGHPLAGHMTAAINDGVLKAAIAHDKGEVD